jgi:hypothetical protein
MEGDDGDMEDGRTNGRSIKEEGEEREGKEGEGKEEKEGTKHTRAKRKVVWKGGRRMGRKEGRKEGK